jgi:hypothetical protein
MSCLQMILIMSKGLVVVVVVAVLVVVEEGEMIQ